MLQKVGLLPPSNLEQLPFAYDMYARDDAESVQLSFEFKRAFSIDVRIKFLGVWYVIQHIDQLPTLNFRVQGHRRVRWIPARSLATLWLEQWNLVLPPCAGSR